uniref:Murine leukemia virus integrase C-terminal domain-containing protein n=1 Tax=Sander lucioperca TaxID=283035 RepID=A0A8C9XJU6_SANLU
MDKSTSNCAYVHEDVSAALPQPAEGPLHQLQPGDFVVVKDFRRKNWQSKRWQGPYQILLTTHTAVKAAERASWIHAAHCRKVPDPGEGAGFLEPATSDELIPALAAHTLINQSQ